MVFKFVSRNRVSPLAMPDNGVETGTIGDTTNFFGVLLKMVYIHFFGDFGLKLSIFFYLLLKNTTRLDFKS